MTKDHSELRKTSKLQLQDTHGSLSVPKRKFFAPRLMGIQVAQKNHFNSSSRITLYQQTNNTRHVRR